MKSLSFCSLFLLLWFTTQVSAQGHPGGGGTGTRNSGGIPSLTTPMPSPGLNTGPSAVTAFLSGKVTLDDGSALTEPAAIQLICRGERHTGGYTDRKGSFSFQFADPSSVSAGDLSDASTTMMTRNNSIQEQRNWRDCELQAVLAGYSSEIIELASRMNTLESVDLGSIPLHRLEHIEGTSISVTSLAAPASAKKALEKARQEEKKGRWAEARKSLEKAVQIYPKYPVAWSELGRVQMRQNDLVSAKKSFEQSLAADSRYVNAYDGLAQLAFRSRQWRQVVEITSKLIALNPVNFPAAYFLSGVAHYSQGDLDAAEKVTRAGVRVDDGHQVPRLQYLLGIILIQKHEYAQASQQIQQYLALVKQPAEIEEAKKELAEIARLTASPSSAAVQEKR
jgi:tetratricopeptide (TPR) repeat protein